jgi:hypothetical protein
MSYNVRGIGIVTGRSLTDRDWKGEWKNVETLPPFILYHSGHWKYSSKIDWQGTFIWCSANIKNFSAFAIRTESLSGPNVGCLSFDTEEDRMLCRMKFPDWDFIPADMVLHT